MSNPLHLIIFKSDLSSRSFQLKPASLFRWSFGVSFLAILALCSTGLAVRYYFRSLQGDPETVDLLRRELVELRRAANPEPESASPTTASPAQPDSGFNTALSGLLSRAKPMTRGTLTIEPVSPRVFWQGKTLQVRFDLKYIGEEGGSQQGRILIFAQGPGLLMAYPARALDLTGKTLQLKSDQGEYFSVSRFRETRATFGPVSSTSDLTSVEVFVLSQDSEILIHQTLTPARSDTAMPSAPTAPSVPAMPTTPAIPPAATGELAP